MNDPNDRTDGGRRATVIDVKRCVVATCEGELAEMSYYERNNWLTAEYKCNACGREFTFKVEY